MSALRCAALVVGLAWLAGPAPADDKKAENKLPADVLAVLDKAEAIELYSLDPADRGEKEIKDDKKAFHGWKVLGQTTLKGDARKAALEAVLKGVKDSDGSAARCFIPRHGIRAVAGDKTADLVICFQCLQIQTFLGDQRGGALTTAGPQPALDKILKDAGVPLPAPADGKP
jgi:hypothetical protein